MKIGAGGLQAMAAHDAARGLDQNSVKTAAEKAVLISEDPAVRRLVNELNKAVERMRRSAETFNQPMDFEVKKGEKPRIKARDRRTGATREFTLEEAMEWLEETGRKRSRLNRYV